MSMIDKKDNGLHEPSPGNKTKKAITIVLICLIFLSSLNAYAAIVEMVQKVINKTATVGIEVDKDAVTGGIIKTDREKIQEELNQKVSATMINISMNLSPVFENGSAMGNLMIVNEDVNNYMQVIEIYRNDNNELIYKSGGIPVGSKIEMAKLDKALEKGAYDCTAYFNAVNSETGELIGKAGARITVSVLN